MALSNACSMSARPTDGRARQRGVALITVLLLVAVLTAIVSRLGLSNEVWIRQVASGAALAQADQANRAAQQWVIRILEQDRNGFDGHTDIWSQPLPPIPIGWGTLQGRVRDMQGRLNLNNLVTDEGKLDGTAMQRFERLLTILELNPGIAEAAADWIDPDRSRAGPWGAEDGYYLGLDPPYLAANLPFRETAELRLIRGVDQAVWQRLEPHVAALPTRTGVNVNTATPEVLAAVITAWGSPGSAIQRAERWAGETDQRPAGDIEAFAERALGAGEAVPEDITVSTEYFMADTQLDFNNVVYRMKTLYERRGGRAGIISHSRQLR